MTKMRPSKSDLPEQIADAIRQAWPGGVIDMPADMDDAPFWKVRPKLKLGLSRIPGTAVFHERAPGGEPQWDESSDPEADPPDWNEESCSYYLFFISPRDDRFQFETETIEPDENGVEQWFQGEGRIGIVVAISLIAPFAVVRLDEKELFENGSGSEPGVEPHIFGLDGRKLNEEEHYGEMVDDEGLAVLRKLRAKVVRVLDSVEIAVIPEEDLDRPVPWLRAGDDVFLGHTAEPITVKQAFFFRGP